MSQVRRQTAVLPRPNWGWQDAAACRGEDLMLFFGPDGERQPERDIRERKAKAVCASCPVRLECLNYAVARPEKYGTWGGLNEDERSAERRRRMRRPNGAPGSDTDRTTSRTAAGAHPRRTASRAIRPTADNRWSMPPCRADRPPACRRPCRRRCRRDADRRRAHT